MDIYTEEHATPTINNVPNKVCGCGKGTQPDPRNKRYNTETIPTLLL